MKKKMEVNEEKRKVQKQIVLTATQNHTPPLSFC